MSCGTDNFYFLLEPLITVHVRRIYVILDFQNWMEEIRWTYRCGIWDSHSTVSYVMKLKFDLNCTWIRGQLQWFLWILQLVQWCWCKECCWLCPNKNMLKWTSKLFCKLFSFLLCSFPAINHHTTQVFLLCSTFFPHGRTFHCSRSTARMNEGKSVSLSVLIQLSETISRYIPFLFTFYLYTN